MTQKRKRMNLIATGVMRTNERGNTSQHAVAAKGGVSYVC